MTNPNDAVGTNAAFDGRTSVKAFNDIAGCFSSAGILSGWECAPDSGMYVVLGGNGTTRDVALAENNTGDKTTINNRSGQPIQLEIAAAPATDSRIDAIVAYVTTPPTGTSTVADNPATVGLIDVVGVEDPSPVAPDDNAIRTAISADGGSGATAYYVILAYVTVANGTTDITNNMISAGASATLNSTQIADGSITSDKIDWATLAWEKYPVTVPAGFTIGEDHCYINRSLKLFRVHLFVDPPNTGTGTTLATGLPEPINSESQQLSAYIILGSRAGEALACWKRASGDTIGCASLSQSEANNIWINGMYPIK